MKRISILIPEGDISLSNVEGMHHIFIEANKWLARQGKPELFLLQMIGKRKSNLMKQDFFNVHPNYLIGADVKSDLVIIPALHTDVMAGLDKNRDLIPWIVDQYHRGSEVMSLCTGAFLLAATGLLDGKKCTTHWIHARQLQELFPNVDVIDEEIMTDELGLYTSGAAYSYLNLIVYVIEKYAGRELALFLSKVFAIDIHRKSQAQFIIFDGYKNHSDTFVLKAQKYIETNFTETLAVDELADRVALGRRNFERRFKMATGTSVIAYVQRVRIEAAKKQLEQNAHTIFEIMHNVGYSDNKSFREVFRKITGVTPAEYRNKYFIKDPVKSYADVI